MNFNFFLLYYICSAIISNFFANPIYIQVFLSSLILFLYLRYISINMFMKYTFYFKVLDYGLLLQNSFLLYFFYIIFLISYNGVPDFYEIVGYRSYLLALPAIYLGFIVHYKKYDISDDLLKLSFLFLFIVALIQFIFVFQNGIESASEAIFPAKGGSGHSFHSTIFFLANSVFNSAKQYSYFILFVGLLVLSKLSYYKKDKKLFIILLMISILITGSRASLVLLLLTILLYTFTFYKNFFIKSIFVGFFLILVLLITLNEEFKILIINYLDFYFSATLLSDYYMRVIEFVDIDVFNYTSIFGFGFAQYGQEFALKNIDNSPFKNINDSGFSKIFIETGIAGTFLILSNYLIILLISLKGLLRSITSKNESLFFVSFIPIFFIIIFFKAHSVHSDIMAPVVFYYSLGCIIYLLENNFKETSFEK